MLVIGRAVPRLKARCALAMVEIDQVGNFIVEEMLVRRFFSTVKIGY